MTSFVPPWVKYDNPADESEAYPSAPQISPPVSVTSSTADPAGSNWVGQFQQSIEDAAQSALRDAAPAIQQQIASFTQQYIAGALTGTPVNPTITGTTLTGKQLTIASAKNRSWRTFLQGMGLDIVFALVAIIGTLGNVNFFSKAGWITLGVLIIKTVVQTVISYIARIKITPPYDKP